MYREEDVNPIDAMPQKDHPEEDDQRVENIDSQAEGSLRHIKFSFKFLLSLCYAGGTFVHSMGGRR